MTSAPLDLDALEAKLAALNSMSFNENWIEKGRALGAELCHAAPTLFALARDGVRWNKEGWQDIDVLREEATALRAENASLRAAPREGTHAPDCHLWGPRHYDCLMREYEASREEVAQLRARIQKLEGTKP